MVFIAFVAVIIIWSTTPLAIHWSSQEVGYLFGVSARMMTGAAVCALLLLMLKRRLAINLVALRTYLTAALGVYIAMLCVYWGAQFIPTGLVSVLFGLTPIITAVMAHIWLQENSLTVGKLVGATLGILGVTLMFKSDLLLANDGIYGVVAVLAAVVVHCASAIWIKRVGTRMPPLDLTAGSLLVVAPLYFFTWWLLDGSLPDEIPLKSSMSILYLGVMGSVVGFTLYFYILKHLDASRVALITVFTPALALLLGHIINGETIAIEVWYGVSCVFAALVFHQWGDGVIARFGRLPKLRSKPMPNVDSEG